MGLYNFVAINHKQSYRSSVCNAALNLADTKFAYNANNNWRTPLLFIVRTVCANFMSFIQDHTIILKTLYSIQKRTPQIHIVDSQHAHNTHREQRKVGRARDGGDFVVNAIRSPNIYLYAYNEYILYIAHVYN